MRALLAVSLLLMAQPCRAEATHAAATRVAYIAGALEAIRATPREQLRRADDYARALARSSCASSVERLRVECLMTAARRWCKNRGGDPRCAVEMDLVVAGILGDAQLISTEKRYQIMSHEKDYRHAIAREVRRIQGALAVDFRLQAGEARDDAELAQKIDHYCVANADDTNLAWPTCVSSLVWFIATDGRGVE